jgi:hypothetical protein
MIAQGRQPQPTYGFQESEGNKDGLSAQPALGPFLLPTILKSEPY